MADLDPLIEITRRMFFIYVRGEFERIKPHDYSFAFQFDETGLLTGSKLGKHIQLQIYEIMLNILKDEKTVIIVDAMVKAEVNFIERKRRNNGKEARKTEDKG